MKKSSVLLVAILSSLVFASGAFAKTSEEIIVRPKPLGWCGEMAEAVVIAYSLQNLGSNESVICSRLDELYNTGDEGCSFTISLSNQLREHEGDLPLREVNMIIYKHCMEELQHKRSNAKR